MNFVREQARRSDFDEEIFERIKLLSFRKHPPLAREQVRRSDFGKEIFERIKLLSFRKHPPLAREQARQGDFDEEFFEHKRHYRLKHLPLAREQARRSDFGEEIFEQICARPNEGVAELRRARYCAKMPKRSRQNRSVAPANGHKEKTAPLPQAHA